jgi:GDSL-like Lipase/Acylhydrolase family/PEP-CTERM motif
MEIMQRRICSVLAGAMISSIGMSAFGSANLGFIMPLGDAVTEGRYITGFIPGSWRDPFYQDATTQGLTFQFAGLLTDNSTPLLTATNEMYHCGYTGDEIDADPANGVGGIDDEWDDDIVPTFDQHPDWGGLPNWILLMVGSHDVIVGHSAALIGQRYLGLLSDLHADDPTAHVLCGSLPPILDPTIPAGAVPAANAAIYQAVMDAQQLGWDDTFVDVGNSFTAADMIDVYHPNQEGDDLLGAAWLNAVVNYTSPVPEPSSMCALGIGGAIALIRRRR